MNTEALPENASPNDIQVPYAAMANTTPIMTSQFNQGCKFVQRHEIDQNMICRPASATAEDEFPETTSPGIHVADTTGFRTPTSSFYELTSPESYASDANNYQMDAGQEITPAPANTTTGEPDPDEISPAIEVNEFPSKMTIADIEVPSTTGETAKGERKEPGVTRAATNVKLGGIRRTRDTDFPAYKEEDLPNPDTELDDEQISSLIRRPPKVRKRYPKYFSRPQGHIHAPFRRLLFERLENGQLRYPEFILRSNVTNWEKTLRGYEHPEQFNRKGDPIRVREATGEPQAVPRKRKIPAVEDGIAAESPKSRPRSFPVGPSASINRKVAPPSAPAGSTQQYSTTQQLEHKPYANDKSLFGVLAPMNAEVLNLLTYLETGDLDDLEPGDIELLVEWTHQHCLNVQQHTFRALGIAMDTHYRHALLDVHESICRVSRSCFDFQTMTKWRHDPEVYMEDDIGVMED